MKNWLKLNWMLLLGALFVISGLSAIASDLVAAIATAAIGAVLMILHFRKVKKIREAPKTATFDVAGLYYHKDELALIRKETGNWPLTAAQIFEKKGRGAVKVYHWRYPKDAELRPETENDRDPNAVAVYFSGKKVGYVPQENSAQAAKILAGGRVSKVRGYISGGEYKQFYTDGSFTVEDSEEDTLRATVTIHYV